MFNTPLISELQKLNKLWKDNFKHYTVLIQINGHCFCTINQLKCILTLPFFTPKSNILYTFNLIAYLLCHDWMFECRLRNCHKQAYWAAIIYQECKTWVAIVTRFTSAQKEGSQDSYTVCCWCWPSTVEDTNSIGNTLTTDAGLQQ